MPRLTASKEEIKGLPLLPEGMYAVRLDGFKPKHSKDKQSINLNPQMKVINHADYNDRVVFDNLNTKAKWIWKDFCHAFGIPLGENSTGDIEFPGVFDGPEDNPEGWQYRGPLVGQTAQLYLVQADNGRGGVNNKIKYYQCAVGGCVEKHSTNLAG